MKQVLLTITLFLTIHILVSGQTQLGLDLSVGKIVIHSKKLLLNAPSYSDAITLSWYKKLNEGHPSYAVRNQPKVGLNMTYLNYRSEQWGKIFAFYPSLTFHTQWASKWQLECLVGVGIGLATRHYQRQPWEDTSYNAIGGTLNNFTKIEGHVSYYASEKSEWSLGLSINHVSSGAVVSPNYGINYVGANLKYNYTLNPSPKVRNVTEAVFPARHRNYISLGYGSTSDRTVIGLPIPIYVFQYKRSNIQAQKMAEWIYGVEYSINKKFYLFSEFNNLKASSISIFGYSNLLFTMGREWFISNFGINLTVGLGYNFQSQHLTHLEKPTLVYYPYGKDYRTKNLWKNIYLSLGLSTKLSVAQYVEFNIGTFW